MADKLTLNVKSDLVQVAKDYAKKQGLSLSLLVENYFKSLKPKKGRQKNSSSEIEISPLIKSLTGVIKGYEHYSDEMLDKERYQHMKGKYDKRS